MEVINTTVEALKGLCAAIKGDATAADISGATIPEVINEITAAYTAKRTKE